MILWFYKRTQEKLPFELWTFMVFLAFDLVLNIIVLLLVPVCMFILMYDGTEIKSWYKSYKLTYISTALNKANIIQI